jgi:dsRNA-specific ribonuclease
MHHSALLTLDNAVAHLYHFCALLPASQHADLRPEFICPEGKPAKVILPLSVDVAVREAHGRRAWLSERNAKKDAAFEAYIALFKAGLVNDHLMPLLKHDSIEEELTIGIEKRPSIVPASAQINPWTEIARAWSSHPGPDRINCATVTVSDIHNEVLSKMELLLPICIPSIPRIRVYWNTTTEIMIDITSIESRRSDPEKDIQKAQNDTWTILNAAFGSRFPVERKDFVAIFGSDLESLPQGSDPILSASQLLELGHDIGLIRHKVENDQPYIFDAWLAKKPPASLVKHPYKDFETVPEDMAHLSVLKLPRRSDFLHEIPRETQEPVRKRFSHVLPLVRCTVDKLPFRITQFAMLMPSILHRLQVYMVGDLLSKAILADVDFSNPDLLVMAITASSAMEETNYQRLEFLGDSLLKICTSMQLLAEYPLWHEGYLTARRDQVISNSRLARAALKVGLDKFIITAPFTGRKWRPLFVQDILDNAGRASRRDMSTKVLADVVEALFGAAKLDGGMSKTLACMRVFLPEIDWQPLEDRRATVFDRAPADILLPPLLEPLEDLIGYTFEKKVLLVEAMTHASYGSGTASLERLEFLGDAVLDSLIVDAIYNQNVELSHVEMHHLRTAFVNADFLAFLCMEWTVDQETNFVVEDEQTHSFLPSRMTVSLALWKFMRRSSQALTVLQFETANRHNALRDDINAALASGSQYPWALLCRLQAPKFYSDIVESLLGAVYIDSGSLDTCKTLIERIGILPYLRRVIRDGVHIMHPKEELGILADMDTVKYVIGLDKKIVETGEKRVYTCEVFVGENHIVTVNDGSGREEVKTKAAELAVKILKGSGGSGTERIMQGAFTGVVDDVMYTT